MNDLAHLQPPTVLAAMETATRDTGFDMASDHLTGALLRTLAASKPGGALLELGTGTGLATAWILEGMDGRARLDSVDNDAAVQTIARHYLGEDARLTIHTADGDRFIPQLLADGTTFDFIFADTWPGKLRLLDEALALVKPGGLYIVDDMTPQPEWHTLDFGYDHPAAMAALTAKLESHSDFVSTKLTWSTGIMICTRRC
jgi:predicted O-methyltransferase YrrM